ncbi:MAG: Type 4 prepilin-like protein leader peptide-processing enzyme [Parcubacteria group bacterium GW2011_GWA2_47_12]|nr:MAG: Type 4 prepilin-like protein leader peptide-processing enzyme [Parcubacteria group bacterium GW2011_GWA2_47_12]
MQSAILVIAFLLGLSIGSFINAWSFRYKTGRSILSASSCFSCGKKLSWIELVPVLSFAFLRRKCRSCKSPISCQYPLVELITGLVFVFIAYKSGFPTTYYLLLTTNFIFWSILIAISVYDSRTTIIPNGAAYFAAALGFLSPALFGRANELFSLEHLIAGPLLALPLAGFWFFSRGRWMGLGDAKLELGIGWFLGLSLGLSGLLSAFWLGALVGIGLIIASRIARRFSFSMKSELPFGPFLALGAFVAWFFEFDITSFFSFYV